MQCCLLLRRHMLAAFLLLCSALFLSVSSCCLAKETYAYLPYDDGTIEQFRINAAGKFIPLSPAKINFGHKTWITKVRIDPSGKYAFAAHGDIVSQFKILKDGTLQLLKGARYQISVKNHGFVDVVLDKTGKFLYASSHAGIYQFRVNTDRSISPLNPPKVNDGVASGIMAIHPTKPLMYVDNGSLSTYHIGNKGTLLPVHESKDYKMSAAYLAIDQAHEMLYVTWARQQTIGQYKIGGGGSLTEKSNEQYGDLQEACCGPTQIFISPIDQRVVVLDNLGRSISIYKLDAEGKIDRKNSIYCLKITRDNKMLKSRQQLEDVVRDKVDAKVPLKNRPLSQKKALERINTEIAEVDKLIAIPITAGFGPDGRLFLVTTSGISIFKINLEETFEWESSALEWDDMRLLKERNKAAERPPFEGDRCPTGLTFLYR